MDGIIDKKKPTKKYRIITSFLIITLSIILLIYAFISDEPIILLVIFILIVKIVDLILNLFRIKKKKHQHRFCNLRNLLFEVRYG
jgi:hypothetical protein